MSSSHTVTSSGPLRRAAILVLHLIHSAWAGGQRPRNLPETLRICDSWGLIHPAVGRVFNSIIPRCRIFFHHSNLGWKKAGYSDRDRVWWGNRRRSVWDRSGMSQRWTLIPNAAVNRPEGQWNDKIFAVLPCMSIKFHACRCEACPRQPRQIKTSSKSLCSVKHAITEHHILQPQP